MRDIRHVVTHRCNELLQYNNDNYKPCAIQFDKWFSFFDYDDDHRTWILKTVETNEEDWDIKYLTNVARVRFCPFCGEELKTPLTLVESEKE